MKRVLENIVIYLSLVFRPRMLVNLVRERQTVSEEIAKATKIATELFQTMCDR